VVLVLQEERPSLVQEDALQISGYPAGETDERKAAVMREKQEREEAEKQRNLALARDAYRAALDSLKQSPTDPDRRERALELGRLYASWTRHLAGQRGVTLFDEISLSNDIQAASAAAATSSAPASLEDRLRRLAGLREQGLITEDELRDRRLEILREV